MQSIAKVLDGRVKRKKLLNLCDARLRSYHFPTDPSTILDPQDQEIGDFYVVQERLGPEIEASKL